VEVDLSNEVLVFTMSRRARKGLWYTYGKVFRALMHGFPAIIVTRKSHGRVGGKLVAFLKRHEHIWANMISLLGWEVVERFEVPLLRFNDIIESVRLEVSKHFETLPPWFAEYFKPTVSFGPLSYSDVVRFIENVKRKFKEYMEAPLAVKGRIEGETEFHRFLRTSTTATLIIRGTYKEGMLRYINDYLYELLSDGVVPVDYSYDSIIVAKKVYRHRGSERIWRSTLNLDPIEVLRGFESVYFAYVFDVKELEFEKRDVGWGLDAKEVSYPPPLT